MNESVGFVEHLRQILTSWGLYDENSISPFCGMEIFRCFG